MQQYSKHLKEQDNQLLIDNVPIKKIAQKYGTPTYILSQSTLEDNLSEIKEHFIDVYENVLPLYASKALSIPYIYEMVQQHGLGVDVVSAGELFIALKSGVNPNSIYFHGSNKSIEELTYAIENQIRCIIVDNFHELQCLAEILKGKKQKINVMLRIVPQVEAGGHAYIQTGNIDTKFGFSTHDATYIEAVKQVLQIPELNFLGLHCHVGSQVEQIEPFVEVASVMVKNVFAIQDIFNIEIPELNIGGGYGIVYTPNQKMPKFQDIITKVMDKIEELFTENKKKRPKILIEPGRSIVGNAGFTLYTVGAKKTIPQVRQYVSVDGSMADNIRPALYQAKYHAFVQQNKLNNSTKEKVTIAGKCCESGDILIKAIELPTLTAGDYLLVPSTGAYNYAMASNYNQLCKPPIIVSYQGKVKQVMRRETFDDLLLLEKKDEKWSIM